MTKSQWFLPVIMVLLLAGCGGGGNVEKPSGNPKEEPEPRLQAALITRGNAGTLLDASFSLMNVTRDAAYEIPSIAYTVWLYTSGGTINEAYTCDNVEGSFAITGTLSATDGTGEIVMKYAQCLNSEYQARVNGAIRIMISGTGGYNYPEDYTVGFESYETASSAGLYRTILSGTVAVIPDTQGGQIATPVLRVTDPINDRYIQSSAMTIHYAVAPGNFPRAATTRVSGTVGHSEVGTVVLSCDTSISDDLRVSGAGNTGVRVSFLNDDNFVAALDTNGDAVPEAYLHASVYELDRSFGENHSPVVGLEDTIQAEQDSTSVSLFGVTDADSDFLDFSVNLLSAPPDSRFDWSIDNAMNLLLHADTVGDYLFTLTANDGHNGMTQKEMHLRVMLQRPVVEPEQTAFAYAIGDRVQIDLSPSNGDQGPFTYAVHPVLPGMTISPSGLLEWQIPLVEHYFPITRIDIEAVVSNADHDVVIPLTLNVTDPDLQQPVVRSGIGVPGMERNIHAGDFDNDGITEILLTDNHDLLYTLEWRGGRYEQDWVYPYAIHPGGEAIDAILPLDLDGDGRYEIYVQTGRGIDVIQVKDNRVTRSLDLSTLLGSVSSSGRGIAAADLDNDGDMELAALFAFGSGSGIAFVLDADDLDLRWQTQALPLGEGMAVGNVDNDPALEIVFAGGLVYDGITQANEWAYREAFGREIVTADVDGSGVDKIIANRGWDPPVIFDAVLKSPLFEITGAADVCSIAAADLDGDLQEEILIGDCQWGNVTAYDAGSGSAVNIWAVSSQDHGTESLAVGDADDDGNPEVIWGTGLSSTSEDSLVVFDAVNRVIDFRNVDPSQLGKPYIGGWPMAGEGRASRVVFGVAQTDAGGAGSRLLALDYDTGEMSVSPKLGKNWSNRFSFAIADYDLDGTDEVLMAGAEFYDGFLAAYDLFDSATEWSVTGDYGTSGDIASGDANGDGHADILAIWGPSIRLYDPFNGVLLWSSIQFTSTPVQVALRDLDGDHVPEILVLFASGLQVYSRQGSTYVEDGVYSDPDGNLDNMLVEDMDGDSLPEIVLAQFVAYSGDNTTVWVLNSELGAERAFSVEGRVTAMTAAQSNDALLLATATGPSHSGSVKLFDLQNNVVVWQTPPLLGQVTRDSLHVVQKPGSSRKRLAIGTADAMYITR